MPCSVCRQPSPLLYASHPFHFAQWEGVLCLNCVAALEKARRAELLLPRSKRPVAVGVPPLPDGYAERVAREKAERAAKAAEDDAQGREFREWIDHKETPGHAAEQGVPGPPEGGP